MDASDWDHRYGTKELIWTENPNQFLVTETERITPGRALDLACGEGRNAIWLAERGWIITGVDFSGVAIQKAGEFARARGVSGDWIVSPVESYQAPPLGFDLVIVFYLQLPEPERSKALRVACSSVGIDGTLLIVAHDVDNLGRGTSGPQSLDLLYDAEMTGRFVEREGLAVERAERVQRAVVAEGRELVAIDTLVRARRP